MVFEEIKRILSTKTVGIAGCGGLGSNCAVSLARCGIGCLVIADFDVVSESNLNRQHFFRSQIGESKVKALKNNIHLINPDVQVVEHQRKLDTEGINEIFQHCDLIIEAFDLSEMKQMIIETVLNTFPEKYIISGNGMAGWGNNSSISTQQYGKLIICGDGVTEISPETPPISPRVNIIAHMQANMALEILLGKMK